MHLIVRLPNWLGDIVMALPALRAVRRAWPEARLATALPSAFAPLMSLVAGIDHVVTVSGRRWRHRTAWRQDVDVLRGGGFDTAILFTNSFASALMMQRAGIAERWGYGRDWRAPLLTRVVARPRRTAGEGRHHSRYYGKLVEALGCTVEQYHVRLDVPDDWQHRGSMLLEAQGIAAGRRYVCFAAGAAYGTAKQWPPARLAQVIRRCIDEEAASCVLVGTQADSNVGDDIVGRTGDLFARGSLVNLIGRTDLAALVGVMARSAAFVSNDSGSMHLAAAVGVPVIAVFGPTEEWATSPLGPHTLVVGEAWCRPCLRRECPLDHRCMTSIGPARVFDALRFVLASRPASARPS